MPTFTFGVCSLSHLINLIDLVAPYMDAPGKAKALAAEGKLRLAGHLAEFAVLGGGGKLAHTTHAEVNMARAALEPFEMA